MSFLQKIFSSIVLAISLYSLCIVSAQAAETYKFDPNHTYVLWHVSHFGFSSPSGKWLADGTLLLDETNPQNSKLDVKIHTATLSTGIPKFDQHLISKDFLDAQQFPDATFVSNKIEVMGNNQAKVNGILTLHGVSKPLTLDVKLNKIGMSAVTNKKTAGFTATTHFKRSDFGIKGYLPGVGDEVNVNIEAEAVLT